MKKYIIFGLMISLVGGACFAQHPRIAQLIAEKQAKMEKLEKCQGTTKKLKIAGISTLGVTAVGVGANIAEAVVLKDAKSKLAESQDAYNEQDCIKKKGGEWVNGECVAKTAKTGSAEEAPAEESSEITEETFAGWCKKYKEVVPDAHIDEDDNKKCTNGTDYEVEKIDDLKNKLKEIEEKQTDFWTKKSFNCSIRIGQQSFYRCINGDFVSFTEGAILQNECGENSELQGSSVDDIECKCEKGYTKQNDSCVKESESGN